MNGGMILAHATGIGWDEMLVPVALPMLVIIGLILFIGSRRSAEEDGPDDQPHDAQR